MRIYFLNHDFNIALSAIEKAGMQRSMLFKQYLGRDVTFMTCDYNPRQEMLRQLYIRRGTMHSGNDFVNMYDHFQEVRRHPSRQYQAPDLRFRDDGVEEPLAKGNGTCVRMGDNLTMYIMYDENNKVDYVNHCKNGILVRSDKYDDYGFLSRSSLVNKKSQIICNVFYREDGTQVLHETYEVHDNVYALQHIHVLDRQGHYVNAAHSREELVILWLQDYFSQHREPCMCLLDRCWKFEKFFINTPKEQLGHVFSVPLLHSIHYAVVNDIHSRANEHYHSFVDKKCVYDAIVTHSSVQRQDLEQRMGVHNIYTIPHILDCPAQEEQAHAVGSPPVSDEAGLGNAAPSNAAPSASGPNASGLGNVAPSASGPNEAGPNEAGPNEAGPSNVAPSASGPSASGLGYDPRLVVYVARLVHVKEHLAAVRIFQKVLRRVPDARMVFYGRGDEEQLIKEAIETAGLTDRILLGGYADNVHAVFQRAALSILTSTLEGFSMSVQESLGNGCPAVSFDMRYGPNEMIVQGENGYLVPPGEEEEFARCVVSILENPALRQRMSINARARMRQLFAPDVVARQWQTLLDEAEHTLAQGRAAASQSPQA